MDVIQCLSQRVFICLGAHVFIKGIIYIITVAFPVPPLVFKTAEIRVGDIWMTMQRNSEHVSASVKDILGAVPVMVVDVKHCHGAVPAKIICCYSGIIKITETAEYFSLCMMTGGANKCV